MEIWTTRVGSKEPTGMFILERAFRFSSSRTDLLRRKISRGRSLCFGYFGGPAVILMDKKMKVQFKAPCRFGVSFRLLPSIYFVLLIELESYRGAHEMEPMSDRSILSICFESVNHILTLTSQHHVQILATLTFIPRFNDKSVFQLK